MTSMQQPPDASSLVGDASLTPSPSGDAEGHTKQASCLQCRKIKVKCMRSPAATICTRCSNRGTHCTIPDYRVGRRKGVPNKRKGLDKAIHQLEQALDDARNSAVRSPENEDTALRLQHLLNEAGAVLHGEQERRQSDHISHDVVALSPLQARGLAPEPVPIHHAAAPAGRQVVEDSENPLQLLAHATEQCLPLPHVPVEYPRSMNAAAPLSKVQRHSRDDELLRTFFGPPRVNLDTGASLDPVNLGLVTLTEAEDLFKYFNQNLAHTRWGLDPAIHTVHFIRQRSAFLFTTVMAAAAKFTPNTAALSTRLSAHCKTLANHVMSNRNRSVEIVIAFLFSVPWLPARAHWEDDEGSSFLANALTISLDLSLDKLIIDSSDMQPLDGVAGRDIISARKALALDGFDSIDPQSIMGRRLLRRRERAWLAVFILDRGFCMSRERRSLFPVDTPLIQRCDGWHISDIAAPADNTLVSVTVIRRDLIGLIAEVKRRCDHYQPGIEDGTQVAEGIRDMIESFLENWFAAWAPVVTDWRTNRIPPYVEIMTCHSRLSIYGLVMNHPTAPTEVHGFFRIGGLSASITLLRTTVQSAESWISIPNNAVILIAFAACLALRLSSNNNNSTPTNANHPEATNGNTGIAHSVRSLVYQTADVLEKIGNTPKHRQGASVLYAMHLRAMVGKLHPPSAETTNESRSVVAAAAEAKSTWQDGGESAVGGVLDRRLQGHQQQQQQYQQQHHQLKQQQNITDDQPLFAEMTDLEFSQALKSVETELMATEGDISADWWNNLDWLTYSDISPERWMR